MVVPTQLTIYGVRVPQLRQIARDWQRTHKQITRTDHLALVEALWEGQSREERLLAVYLLERYHRWIPELNWADFDRWRRRVDNWEVGDGLAMWVLGPWLLADPQGRLDHLRQLIPDPELWSRRLALVATVPVNRSGPGFAVPELTLELVGRVRAERDPMITKAVSWALRGLAEVHPKPVAAYLEANRDLLAPLVVREVSAKLSTGLKSGRSSPR